jgi:hypothetical protein
MRLATEYQFGNVAGTADTQQYWNTTLVMAEKEPNLPSRIKVTGQVKASKMHSPDGGKTWIIDHVTIPAKTPGTEWKGE